MSETNTTALEPLTKNDLTLSMEDFSPAEIARVQEIAKSIDIHDTQSVIEFGMGTQSEIANFSDTIMNEVTSKDSGYVGETLSELMIKVKEVDVNSISSQKKGLFNGLKRRIRKFIARYDKLSTQIDRIVESLETARDTLFRDIELLDKLHDKNESYIKELDIYIAAGDIAIKQLRDNVLPPMRIEAEQSKDSLKAQEMKDLEALINRFEKKVYDLKLSRQIALQSMPQIRLIQNSDQVLVERIQSSILNTIPLWKNQIVIAITLFRQRKALQIQREVTDTTNELLKKNSELLKSGTIETAKEVERGIVDIETLRQVNNDLIETIEESIRIQQEGSVARQNAEKELKDMEQNLKEKLLKARA
jgi:uncharacterized protein YaaN involved in tellurite resistance